MSLRTFEGSQPVWRRADQLRAGQWIVDPQNARFDRHIVEVGSVSQEVIYDVKVSHDFGHGGEPATSFYRAGDQLLTLDSAPQ